MKNEMTFLRLNFQEKTVLLEDELLNLQKKTPKITPPQKEEK